MRAVGRGVENPHPPALRCLSRIYLENIAAEVLGVRMARSVDRDRQRVVVDGEMHVKPCILESVAAATHAGEQYDRHAIVEIPELGRQVPVHSDALALFEAMAAAFWLSRLLRPSL